MALRQCRGRSQNQRACVDGYADVPQKQEISGTAPKMAIMAAESLEDAHRKRLYLLFGLLAAFNAMVADVLGSADHLRSTCSPHNTPGQHAWHLHAT